MSLRKRIETAARQPIRFAKRRLQNWQRSRTLVRGKWVGAKGHGVHYALPPKAESQGIVLGFEGFVVMGTLPRDAERHPVLLRTRQSGRVVARAEIYRSTDVPWLQQREDGVRAFEIVLPFAIWKMGISFPLQLTVEQNEKPLDQGTILLTVDDVRRSCELMLTDGSLNLSTLHVLGHLLALPEGIGLPEELLEPLHAFAKKSRSASRLPTHLLPKNDEQYQRAQSSSERRPRPVFDLLEEFNRRVCEFDGREHELFRLLVKKGQLSHKLEAKALSSVLPYFCSIDRVEALLKGTRAPTIFAVCSLRGSWARSYAAAIFGIRGQTQRLARALNDLGRSEKFNAVAVGHGMSKYVSDDNRLADKERLARVYFEFLERLANDPWAQLHDDELIRGAVATLRALHAEGSKSYEKSEGRALCIYGMSPHFWRALHQIWEHPPEHLLQIERLFWSLDDDLMARPDGSKGQALVESTAPFVELGCIEEAHLSISLAQGVSLHTEPSETDLNSAVRAATHGRENQKLRYWSLPGATPDASALDPKLVEASYRLPNRSHRPVVKENKALVMIHSTRARLDAWAPKVRATWQAEFARRKVRCLFCVGSERQHLDGDVLTLFDPCDAGMSTSRLLAAAAWAADQDDWEILIQVPDATYVSATQALDRGGLPNFDYAGLSRWHSGAEATATDVLSFVRPSADLRFGVCLSRHAVKCLLEQRRDPNTRCVTSHAADPSTALAYLLKRSNIHLRGDGYFCHQAAVDGRQTSGRGYRSFEPSPSSPTKVVAVDAPPALEILHERTATGLRPSRLWPATLSPAVGHNQYQIDLLSPTSRLQKLATSPAVVVAVMYNELLLAKHFLNHYRRIGVKAFAICDNDSNDGTREFLRDQEDVVLYGTDSSYRDSRYGTIWQQALLDAHCLGRWALVVDADEFFVYPRFEREPLESYLQQLETGGYDASWQALVDMYPLGDLREADFRHDSPWDVCPYFDAHPLKPWRLSRGRYSCTATQLSSFRHRTIACSEPFAYTSQKNALFRYRPWIRLGMGIHCVSNIHPAPDGTALAHFKYHAGFQSKVAEGIARNEHFNNALEYRNYQAQLAETRGHFGKPNVSERWTDSETLLARFRAQPQPCPPQSPEEQKTRSPNG